MTETRATKDTDTKAIEMQNSNYNEHDVTSSVPPTNIVTEDNPTNRR